MAENLHSDTVDAILSFWFGTPDAADYGTDRAAWFVKDPKFDEDIKTRFEDVLMTLTSTEVQQMANSPEGAVAAVVLFDQFPRNIYRNDARAFATDAQALSLARQAVNRGFDQKVIPVMRKFLYLPFEHSENLEDQNMALALFATLGPLDLDYAQKHFDIIARFGRFPHRNEALGRTSTTEEIKFLSQPGSSF
ncbi:DUF924 family protein [Magnetovibrio blakemorei]|uniref:DUF924 domain-containing protein n=1 Tax=Magnetovibrio blakemorei TaxID=28181 RepID=A0A1E5QB81_9PROT|nr:DUF924 family protein [Magnetovibrio blakemorei]OEJ69292.1 hypothetical protein BEN30_04225 [Magnetovibrio blakemorei]